MMDDDASFSQWYHRVHPRLRATLVAVSGNPDAALDAADEACIRAWQHWSRVRRMDSPDGWLYRTGVHVLKRTTSRARMERILLRRVGAADSVVEPDTSALLIWRMVADLPVRQRQAVALRHLGGLRDQEIADVMSITRGTVSATLHSAYGNLRRAVTMIAEEASR